MLFERLRIVKKEKKEIQLNGLLGVSIEVVLRYQFVIGKKYFCL